MHLSGRPYLTIIFMVLFALSFVSCGYWYYLLKSPQEKLPVMQKGGGMDLFRVACNKSILNSFDQEVCVKEQWKLFSSEPRVRALGSNLPIPLDATICPYAGIPQPLDSRLDRDADGLADDWERRFGLSDFDASDADIDTDVDGFTGREEFMFQSDPRNPSSTPPLPLKLRLGVLQQLPMDFVFSGEIHLKDGSIVVQMNQLSTGYTHFMQVGECFEGLFIEKFKINEHGFIDHICAEYRGNTVLLLKGVVGVQPQIHGQLINLLDQSSQMVTMGTLLSLNDDIYTVCSLCEKSATIRAESDGKLYSVPPISAQEKQMFSAGFDEEGE